MIAKANTYIPSVATTAKSLSIMKVGAQERKYVKNVKRRVLTTQNPPGNNLNVLTKMEITRLTLGSVQHGKEKKNPENKIYSKHPFSRGKKIFETTLQAWSYSRVTQPIQNPSIPECHKCNLLIEKLLHLKPEEFSTLLKELQASIPQTKQPPLSEPDPKENLQPETNEAEDQKKSNQTNSSHPYYYYKTQRYPTKKNGKQ